MKSPSGYQAAKLEGIYSLLHFLIFNLMAVYLRSDESGTFYLRQFIQGLCPV